MRTTLAALLLVGTLLAPQAGAIYLVTPLVAEISQPQAEPGDTVTVDLRPVNDSARDAWGGKSVRVTYTIDQGAPPDSETSNAEPQRYVIAESLPLADDATGSFTWTVPAHVDDANIDFRVDSGDELLAHATLGVGDAPPRILAASSGPGQGMEETDAGGEPTRLDSEEGGDRTVPAVTVLLVLAVLGVMAIALRRR